MAKKFIKLTAQNNTETYLNPEDINHFSFYKNLLDAEDCGTLISTIHSSFKVKEMPDEVNRIIESMFTHPQN